MKEKQSLYIILVLLVVISLAVAGVIVFGSGNKPIEDESQTVETDVPSVTKTFELSTSETEATEARLTESNTIKDEKVLPQKDKDLSSKKTYVTTEESHRLNNEQINKYRQSTWYYEGYGSEDYCIEISDIDQEQITFNFLNYRNANNPSNVGESLRSNFLDITGYITSDGTYIFNGCYNQDGFGFRKDPFTLNGKLSFEANKLKIVFYKIEDPQGYNTSTMAENEPIVLEFMSN